MSAFRPRFPRSHALFLGIAFAGTLVLGQIKTVPPLPEGAYPEWSLEKARQQHSPQRSRICLNGLWRFRAEPRLKHAPLIKNTYFEEDSEEATIENWDLADIPNGGSIRCTFDPEEKQSGAGSMRVDCNVPPRTNFYHITRIVKGVASSTKLELRADIKSEMKTGKLHIEVQDARDYKFYTAQSAPIRNTGKWETATCDFRLPPGTSEIKVLILRNHGCTSGCQGRVWIDNLRIVEVDHPPMPGLEPPNDDAWGFSLVPGSWRWNTFRHPQDTNPANLSNLNFGWYEREITIPATWGNRRILLDFDRLSTDAHIYCDGVAAGELGYLGGKLDISKYAVPGKTLKLSVLVEGRKFWYILPSLLSRPSKVWKQKLSLIGIVGDVHLISEPMTDNPRLGASRIVTAVKNQKLSVTSEIIPPEGKELPGDLTLLCEVRDGNTVVKSMETDVSVDSATTTCSDKWKDAECWDIGKPRLYTMTVSLLQNGRIVDSSLPETFGFRDFEIRGKFFYLNDIKLNLVPCAYSVSRASWKTKAAMRHWIKGARAAGYNFVYLGEADKPGMAALASHFLDVCDELGILAAVSPLHVGRPSYLHLDKTEVWEPWTKIVAYRIRKDWNHPSLVMWRQNMNLNCYRQDQNPLVLDGKMEFQPGSPSDKKEQAMLKSNAFVRSLDPTRPTYNHACGKSGEIYNLNNYLGWPELQDLREWLRVWAQNGKKPLFMAEQATPYPGDFQMRDPSNWWTNEPVMTEYGAILLGEESYQLEEEDYIDYYDKCWREKSKSWGSSYNYFCHNYPPILDICSSRYYEAMLPAWRTWGISGGVNAWENTWRRKIKKDPGNVYAKTPPPVPVPIDWENLQQPGFVHSSWEYANGGGGEIRTLFDLGLPEEEEYFEPTLRSQVMPELIAPLYAYIGGPKNDWFTQDHAFRSEETIRKSVILLNDLREPCTFAVRLQLQCGGTTTDLGSQETTIDPAESDIVPFKFRAPTVSGRTTAILITTVTNQGETIPTKPFPLEIYPPEETEKITLDTWRLFDPVGKTTKAFRRAGLKVDLLETGAPLPTHLRVLVIGCNALEEPGSAEFLNKLAGDFANGLQVLVFEQSAKSLSDIFGLRCFTPGIRRVWIRDAAHPALAGLCNADLRNWRGKTTLGPLDGPPESLDQVQRAKRVWRCSQEGVVASTVVEKPHLSAFRPLLDTGFDLRYSALWEVPEGRGRLLFCQLDITDRIGMDPVADRILGNLVAHFGHSLPTPPRRAFCVVEPLSRPLRDLPTTDTCPDKGDGLILLLPRGSQGWLKANGAKLPDFLESGGKLLAAGLTESEGKLLAQSVGKRFALATRTLWLNPIGNTVPTAFRGISPAGIHWRRKLTLPTIASVPDNAWNSPTGILASIPVGQGEIIWISPLPRDFDAGQRPDLVFSRVNTERLYSTVLGNLGVSVGRPWTSKGLHESNNYSDKRFVRDDPYADMRW